MDINNWAALLVPQVKKPDNDRWFKSLDFNTSTGQKQVNGRMGIVYPWNHSKWHFLKPQIHRKQRCSQFYF